jgi:hypothetical protein
MNNPRTLTLVGMIFLAALSRIVPHPWNFAPITAMALFAGSHFLNKRRAFGVPLAALLVSDVLLGFYSTMFSTYLAFALIVLLGFWIGEKRSLARIAGATLAGSAVFFVVTNFAVWMLSGMYPRTLDGFVSCYTLAVPFFRNTLLGDAFYSAVLFGSFAWAERTVPALRPSAASY